MLYHRGSAVTPSLCPPSLLAEIVRINHLRLQARTKATVIEGFLTDKAYRILNRIHKFSPEQLAESKPSSKEDWRLVGSVFKSAVILYCILSLQSASLLPETATLGETCTNYGRLLQASLAETLSSPRTKRYMLWPVVVLGVEAAHSGLAMRAFIAEQLPELSRAAGTSVPLTALTVLKSFWTSDDIRWDACFDRPYPFTMQIAVDVSQVLRS